MYEDGYPLPMEMTPEMTEAGFKELSNYHPGWDDPRVKVDLIFSAIMIAYFDGLKAKGAKK